jgi:dihydropteroate synthase
LSSEQRSIVVPALQEAGGTVQEAAGGTVRATVSGAAVGVLAARWRSRPATRQLGLELAAAWQPLAGVVPLPPGAAVNRIGPPRGALAYGDRALVMGIINVTPDSFYPASRFSGSDAVAAAVAAARRMAGAGADIIDVGGESTRPGALPVTAAEEIDRVVPVVQAIVAGGGPPVSVDTSKAEVAAAALDAGAVLVNDVCGLRDPRLRELVAARGVPAVVMHMRGTPRTMQRNVRFTDPVGEVLRELKQRLNAALAAGIRPDCLIVDPGIGFGKRLADNLRLLEGLPALRSLGPVLVGLSRKSFLGALLEAPVEQRLAGTTVANTIALLRGADILRVHDAGAAAQAVRLVAALENPAEGA